MINVALNCKHNSKRNTDIFFRYGFDVLIDSELKPWILEVNASPSLMPSDYEDNKLKVGMIIDVLAVLDYEKRLTKTKEKVGGFDLICKGEPITKTTKSYLGRKGL